MYIYINILCVYYNICTDHDFLSLSKKSLKMEHVYESSIAWVHILTEARRGNRTEQNKLASTTQYFCDWLCALTSQKCLCHNVRTTLCLVPHCMFASMIDLCKSSQIMGNLEICWVLFTIILVGGFNPSEKY